MQAALFCCSSLWFGGKETTNLHLHGCSSSDYPPTNTQSAGLLHSPGEALFTCANSPWTVCGVFIGSGRSNSGLTCTIATARRAVTSEQ